METILSFVALSLLIIAGAYVVDRARRFANGSDDRREMLESLAGMCQSGMMSSDESRAVKLVIESKLRCVK